MHFSVVTYKHSGWATCFSIFGTLFLITGLYTTIGAITSGDFPFGLVFCIIGALMLFFAPRINKRAVNKKLQKSLSDPELILRVQRSAVAAYSLFMNAPSLPMMQYLEQLNPEAAKLIAAKQAGMLTEDELLLQLRNMDGASEQHECEQQPHSDLKYENEMFKLENMYTLDELAEKKRSVLTKQKKQRKVSLYVCGAVFLVALVTFIICIACTTQTVADREIVFVSMAKKGDYTELTTKQLTPHYTDGGYVYCEAKVDYSTTVDVRFPESEQNQFDAMFHPIDYGYYASNTLVSIYGEVVEYKGMLILDGSFEREQETHYNMPMPWTVLACVLLFISGICLILFGVTHVGANKELKALTEQLQHSQQQKL